MSGTAWVWCLPLNKLGMARSWSGGGSDGTKVMVTLDQSRFGD